MRDKGDGRIAPWARRGALALCVAGLTAVCGCVAVGIGVVLGAGAAGGAIVYFKGNLTQPLNAPGSKVHNATLKALNDLNLPVIRDKTDANVVKLESEFPDGKRLWIEITAVNTQSTDVCVRVGYWGDEELARQVLAKIQSHL